MGFFSKIKKLWKSEEGPAPDVEQVAEQAADAAAEEAGAAAAEESSASPTVSAPHPPAAPPASESAPWRDELALALRQAEPRLSEWLGVVLEGVEESGELLWERLKFLFQSLEAPAEEAESFVRSFAQWLEDMEYRYVDEFRSELQYKLALALDLEDEEDERNRMLLKLGEGLAKTKEQITRRIDGLLSSHETMDEAFWEELEEILIMADVGFESTSRLLENLRERVRKAGLTETSAFKDVLREELEAIFKAPPRITAVNPPEVVLMIGVNGAGKTTTVAKLAHRAAMQGRKVLMVAGDTFRAAAIEQLEVWSKRAGVGFFAKSAGSDPAAVAYEAVDHALKNGYDLVFVDTAGRLHTKVDLMDELRKIYKVLGKKHPGAPHRTLLVLDATTGQNALSQCKLFGDVASIDEVVLTKLDGTAKGGVVVAIAMQYGLPITFVGLGEKMEDLRPFDGKDFAQALLGAGGETEEGGEAA